MNEDSSLNLAAATECLFQSAGGATEGSPRRKPWVGVAFRISPVRGDRTVVCLWTMALSPLTGLMSFATDPTAYAVGYLLSPHRGS